VTNLHRSFKVSAVDLLGTPCVSIITAFGRGGVTVKLSVSYGVSEASY